MKERYIAIGSYDGKIYFHGIIEARSPSEAQLIAHEKTMRIIYKEEDFQLKPKTAIIVRTEPMHY